MKISAIQNPTVFHALPGQKLKKQFPVMLEILSILNIK